MQYTKEITVDLSGEMYFSYITAVQGDENSRFVKITLLSGGVAFVPPEGAIAALRCKKPDGTFAFNDATINEDGTITAELTGNMLAAVGNCRCEVTIYDNGSALTSVPFIVKVTPGAVDPDVESTDEYAALTAALKKVQDVDGVSAAALAEATSAFEKMADVEASVDEHTAAAASATERANTAAAQAEAVVEQAGELVTRYGVRFGGSANSGSTVQRLYNAVGLVAGVGTDTDAAENNFDNIYPWSDIHRCCGYWGDDGNFVVNAYKGEPGYAVDGSNGEVWVEIPLFYYKHTYTEGAEEIVISAFKLPGFMPSPIHEEQGTKDAPAAKAYLAAYPMAEVDDMPTSRSGIFSGIFSLNTAMTAARKAGENYTVSTTAERYSVCLLMWVEFATRDLQSIMRGACDMPYSVNEKATVAESDVNRIIISNTSAAKFVVGQTIGIGTLLGSTDVANNRVITAIEVYNDSNKAISFDGDAVDIAVDNIVFTLAWKNGSCDNVIASSGSPVSNTSGKYNCIYRGIEQPYGNCAEWISDILLKREGAGTTEDSYRYDIYYLPDVSKYANGAISDVYIKLNYNLSAKSGYIKTLGTDKRFLQLRLPYGVDASSSTYYCDGFQHPRYTICAARCGGGWNQADNVGPTCWNMYYHPDYTGVSYRARISYCRRR